MTTTTNTAATKNTPHKYYNKGIRFGCDPEFFITRKKTIIGSEKVIPEDGLDPIEYQRQKNPNGTFVEKDPEKLKLGRITRDGIQIELNPRAFTCREQMGSEIGRQFEYLNNELAKDKDLTINFKQTVKITKKEMNSLSENSKKFGCSASMNAYAGIEPIGEVDASKIFTRSAGGHIHIGLTNLDPLAVKTFEDPRDMIKLLDIMLGNTCVMIDRSDDNIERRKLYGKAGEYRTKEDRIEYRTLSNFWLQDYKLMHMVMGIARQAVSMACCSTPEMPMMQTMLSLVSEEDIQNAINNNDIHLAKKNWNKIKNYLISLSQLKNEHSEPIHAATIKEFEYFLEQGLKRWFKGNPTKKWITRAHSNNGGFENLLVNTVRKAMLNPTKQDLKTAKKKKRKEK